MRVKIYQINSDRDSNHTKFRSYKDCCAMTGVKDIDSSIYDKVLDADIDFGHLEELFYKFNTDMHPLFRGHSMSTSDIVVTDKGAYFCDSIGFKKVDFDESKAVIPSDTYSVVYVEPHKPAYRTEIGKDLQSLQKAVGGFIETIYDTDDETVYVGNEESKLMGMDGNIHMSNGHGIIAGPFFVIGEKGDNFRSLTEEETEKYLDKFSVPEDISQEEVQNDTGFQIFGFSPQM